MWSGSGRRDELFAPGLAELGLAPERLIVVRARARAARLWALEEALRSPGLAAALAEVDRLSLTQSRRLQLAAEAKGVTALLLRPPGAGATPSAAATRWRIESSAQRGGRRTTARRAFGPPHWRVEPVAVAAAAAPAAGGSPGGEEGWHEIADPLALAAESGDRPAAAAGPARRRRA